MARETRKCGTCGKDIIVSRQNLDNIAFYQGYHHHLGCLVDKAEKGIESGKRVANWEKLLNKIPELQAESKRKLEYTIIQDEFNDYLLMHYDVTVVSNRFWNIVSDLGLGSYKHRKCNPIDIETIMGTWKWGQKHLDKIAANNKAKHKGPSNDEQRLNYDLAIVVSHVSQYLAHINKINAEEEERKAQVKNEIKIDYNKIQKQNASNGLGDISDLLDDLI